MLAFNQRAGDWIINSCFNCGTDIYITHVVKGDKTFVLPGVVVSIYCWTATMDYCTCVVFRLMV